MPRPVATAITCMMCGGLLATAARAQCDYSLITHLSSELDGGAVVLDLTVFDDGSGPALVAAGFDLLRFPGASDWSGIAKWSPATGWVPFGTSTMSSVRDVQVFDSDLYCTTSQGLLRWTGEEWVQAGVGLIGFAHDPIVFDDGSVTGPALFTLTSSYSPTLWRLMKLERGAWREIGQFPTDVWAIEVFSNRLIVAGPFTSVNGMPVNHIASWDGTRWSDLGDPGSMWATDLAVHEIAGSSALVACGSFALDDNGGVPTDVVYWNSDDWFALPEIEVENQDGIGPMISWDNGLGSALYVSVTTESPYSGDSHDTLHRLDPVTQRWEPIASTTWLPSSGISAMEAYHDGTSEHPTLFVGGLFDSFGVTAYHLARVLPQPPGGIQALPSHPASLTGNVRALAGFDDGNGPSLYAGGRLRGMGDGTTLVARFDGDSWASIGHWGGEVLTLKAMDDGNGIALYAGGSFSNIEPNNGQSPSRIARWDGVNWLRMGSPLSTVIDMCMHDDGTGPTVYCVLEDDRVVKWNPASATWTTISTGFTALENFGPQLNAVASFDDGSGPALYVGGRFNAVGGVQASNIIRWRSGAQGWSAVGEGRPTTVAILHVHNEGSGPRLLAGAGALAAWDGMAWSAVGDAIAHGLGGTRSLTTFSDGKGPALMVGMSNGIARWNGSHWAYLPRIRAESMASVGDALYVGSESTFSIWAPGGDQLAIGDQSDGGSFEGGTIISLQVEVIEGGAATYQWRHNGVPIDNIGASSAGYSNAHTSRITIYTLNGFHEGIYDLVVTNDCTQVVSEPIEVDVIGTCLGDIDANGTVDHSDLAAVIGAWGTCPPNQTCIADLTHDGAVNINDLLIVLNRWGACP